MDTSSWKWFRYDQIFDIKHGFYNKKPEDNPSGDIPFIGATDSNNGVTSHSDLETIAITTKTGDGSNAPLEDKIFANCLAVTNNGSVGYAYYQAKPFTCTHDVNPLYLKGCKINPYIALFLCTLIEKERFRWAYGRKWRPIRMPSSKIKLPVTAEGTPDWNYMETFIKDRIIPQLPKKAQRVWLQKYNTQPMLQEKMKLNTQDWKWFIIGELFDVQAGKYHYSTEYEEGKTPYLSATAVNNGVGGFISLSPEFSGGVLTTEKVGCNAFYQPKPFCATSDVNIIRRKDGKEINQYVGLFLASIIDFNESYRWTYGRQCRVNDTQKIRIKLPVTPSGTPDWQFMEDYIKSLPYSRNIEPSDPNEQVDELIEVKRKVLALEHQLQVQQHSDIHYHINAQNISLQTEGTINIGEINDK